MLEPPFPQTSLPCNQTGKSSANIACHSSPSLRSEEGRNDLPINPNPLLSSNRIDSLRLFVFRERQCRVSFELPPAGKSETERETPLGNSSSPSPAWRAPPALINIDKSPKRGGGRTGIGEYLAQDGLGLRGLTADMKYSPCAERVKHVSSYTSWFILEVGVGHVMQEKTREERPHGTP